MKDIDFDIALLALLFVCAFGVLGALVYFDYARSVECMKHDRTWINGSCIKEGK